MELLPHSKVNGILGNFRTMFNHNDIRKMNKSGYGFIYLASGFIAHYNMYGFIEAYGQDRNYDMTALAVDIVNNAESNKWLNFRAGERDYEYMMQKAEIYKGIYLMAVKFLNEKYNLKIEITDFKQRNPFWYGQNVVIKLEELI